MSGMVSTFKQIISRGNVKAENGTFNCGKAMKNMNSFFVDRSVGYGPKMEIPYVYELVIDRRIIRPIARIFSNILGRTGSGLTQLPSYR